MSTSLNGANALTAAFNSGAFAAAVANFTNAALINYAINGRFLSRAIVASQALVIEPNSGIVPTAPNTLQPVPAGKACAFAIILDSAGAFTVNQGDIVDAGSPCSVPVAPLGKAIVGCFKVNNASAGAFTPGTTTLVTGGGITVTFTNLAQHPGASV